MSKNNKEWKRKKEIRALKGDISWCEQVLELQNGPHWRTHEYLKELKSKLKSLLKDGHASH